MESNGMTSSSEENTQSLEHVLIVGAGLAGLALAIGLRKGGYRVTVLERTPELQEIGAGIQIPANSSKILKELGVTDEVKKFGVLPRDVVIRSYRGQDLYTQNINPYVEQTYSFPHFLIHRADIRRILYDAALANGADVKLGALVTKVDLASAIIELDDGTKHTADLVVGADGEHSICRETLLGRKDPPRSSGDIVFRIAVPSSKMESDPLLAPLIDPPCVHAWYGPSSHAVCYQLQEGGIFNIVLTLPEKEGAATIGPQPAALEMLREACKDWDPRFRKLLNVAEKALKWTLLQTDEIVQWHHSSGKFILLGDSAHATLPYLAQGAAIALESAYILAEILANRPVQSDMPSLLAAYATSRLPRVRMTRQRSKAMHDMCQLEDGPEQSERDRVFREEQPGPGFPNPWADPSWQEFMWGFDAKQEAKQLWEIWSRNKGLTNEVDSGEGRVEEPRKRDRSDSTEDSALPKNRKSTKM